MNVHARNLYMVYGKNNLVKPKTFMQKAFNLLEEKFSFMNCAVCNNLSTIVNKTEEVDFSQEKMLLSHAGKGIKNKHALGLPDCPIANVTRDGKKSATDARDLVLGDVVWVKAGFDEKAPCDMLLIEGEVKSIGYMELLDEKHRDILEFKSLGRELPSSVFQKKGSFCTDWREGFEGLIINAPNFLPMGSRIISGEAKGICIRIGNQTI